MLAGGPSFGPDASPHAIVRATTEVAVSATIPEANRISAVKDSEKRYYQLESIPYGIKLSGGITLCWPPASPHLRFGLFTPALRYVTDIGDVGDLLDEDLRQLIDAVPDHCVAGT